MTSAAPAAHAIILAGGRGTRFWPRSRTRSPKQLLNIAGQKTMLEQTYDRLAPLFSRWHIWVVTNNEQVDAVRRQMSPVPSQHTLIEPFGRNTAAAIGLAAVHLLKEESGGDALMAVLPADHFIGKPSRYRQVVRVALRVAAQRDALVVLGIPPSRPETGYGYIERVPRDNSRQSRTAGEHAYAVRRFTEKPSLKLARNYVASGRYLWNAGMFFWRVSTFLENLKRHLPKTHAALMRLAETIGTSRYAAALEREYSRLQDISVDYALLEPASRDPRHARVFVIPASIDWSDIGSWAAVYELLAKRAGANVSTGRVLALDASGNLIWSPSKFVAAVGVSNLVVVETSDALLVCSRERAQDVGRVVKWLEQNRLHKLL
ncbi:MAG: mannose-1-phosphate guanylyltransferase [Acidobacteria bacterium]|nr:MAG: mannose-1-phosphate guanylyltransferase [Acidobacteriota bacterium]